MGLDFGSAKGFYPGSFWVGFGLTLGGVAPACGEVSFGGFAKTNPNTNASFCSFFVAGGERRCRLFIVPLKGSSSGSFQVSRSFRRVPCDSSGDGGEVVVHKHQVTWAQAIVSWPLVQGRPGTSQMVALFTFKISKHVAPSKRDAPVLASKWIREVVVLFFRR